MNHGNLGQFDPNQGLAHVYDPSTQQQQLLYVQDYEVVDPTPYSVQHPQNIVSYSSGSNYSSSQPAATNVTYYGPTSAVLPLHHAVYEQTQVQVSPPINLRQHYYDPMPNQSGYIYYDDQVEELQPTQYGQQVGLQRGYGAVHSRMMQEVSRPGHYQTRPQPMTPEQLQLSQQRLLGLVAPTQQTTPQPQQQQQSLPQMQQVQLSQQRLLGHQPPQQHRPQVQQHQPQQFVQQQTLAMQRQQPQQFQVFSHPQQQFQAQSQQQQPRMQLSGAAAVFSAPAVAHGSPEGSSRTSSSTDISDEGDELFGGSSPNKRSPTGDTSSKRQGKKRRVHKDPNEPQKPVSAYALFFRDTQATIKGQNPNASFGDVSKIVASRWEDLDAEGKNGYKHKTEFAKKEYLKQLAAYRANMVSKGNGSPTPAASVASPVQFFEPLVPRFAVPSTHQWTQPSAATATTSLANSTLDQKPQQPPAAATQESPVPPEVLSPAQSEPCTFAKPNEMCIRPGCKNPSVECAQWDGEYCTDECLSKNCRDVFNAWVQSKQPKSQDELNAIVPS